MKVYRLTLIIFKRAAKSWFDDNASRLAAALAFYTGISLAPLLVILIGILGAFYGEEAAKGQLVDQIAQVTDRQAASFIQTLVSKADKPTVGSVSGVLSFFVLLWGATNLFAQLQGAMNTIWNVQLEPDHGFVDVLKERLFSFGMVLVIAFLLVVSLVFSAAIAHLSSSFNRALPGMDWIWVVVNVVVSLTVVFLLFAAIFKAIPDAKIEWGDVWLGAFVTAILFTLGKFVLGTYLGTQTSIYGAAGSLMAILLWVYYTAQIVFFGSEITQVYTSICGSGVEPADNAEFAET